METSSPASLLSFSSSDKNSRPAMSLSVEFCVVCGDRASGRHYGAISCEGCKGFFKRSIRKQLGYTCRGSKDCEVTKHHRNRCQYCRLQKCLSMGMRSDSVQSERKPASDKKSESPSLLTTANLFLRSDLSANSALSATGQALPSPGLPWNTDLSTLASVVTSLASIRSDAFASAAVQNSSLQTPVKVKMEEDDDSEDSASTNGEMVNSALHLAKENLISKAFDTMAKNMNGGNAAAAGTDYEDDALMELDGPIIAEGNIPFHLTTPSPMPVFLNAHYICESASRLLFLSVHWARSVAAFQLLSSELQISLVRGCWSELFVLGMSQCCHVMSLPAILTAIITQLQASIAQDKVPTQRVKQVTEHVLKLQDYVNSMSRLQIDEHEYAYLKALVLFSPDHAGSSHSRHMERIHDRLLKELRAYVSQTWPHEAEQRFPKLLLRLPLLRSLQPALMEELFFAGLIGAVHIDSVIPYILKMESTEYNGQLSNNGGGGQQPSSPAASNHRNSPV